VQSKNYIVPFKPVTTKHLTNSAEVEQNLNQILALIDFW
jgi:hypothetical protein